MPQHDTSNASQTLQDYYNIRQDFFWQRIQNNREAQFGTDGAETIYGTDGQDALDGHVANPEIDGGDVLIGGAGRDAYFLSDDQTRVVEEQTGEHGDRVVTSVDYVASEHLNEAGTISEIEIVEAFSETVDLVDMSAVDWWVGFDAFGDGGITYLGGSNEDDVTSEGGNDTIITNDGNDYVWSGGGDDVIDLGNGNDEVRAGAGNDIITGGAGADTFTFHAADGAQADVITDWEAGVDACLIGDVNMNVWNVADTAEGALLTYAEGCTVLFQDRMASEISESDFILYYDDASQL